jgi:hypothetical protein
MSIEKKKCNGPCGKPYPLTETYWRPREDAADGFRGICRMCESKMGGLRRDGIKAAELQNDPGPQPVRKTLPKSKVYVVTYAQNATPIYEPFFRSLLNYCESNNAELIVLPGRYKNPTSIWNDNNRTDEWWDKRVHPYKFDGRKTLGQHLTIFGDISIQPTAVRPLTGFEVFSGETSAIFGHPKLQLKTIATAKRYYPRILTSTGAVTKPNYTKSKAGKKAEAHHIYGATIIEQGVKLFHTRQINATPDGSFIDLETLYTPEGIKDAGRALGVVFGDIHVERSDVAVLAATFDRDDSIMKLLRPKVAVFHDVLDFERRNHHTINDFFERYARVRGRKGDVVETEVLDAIRFIDERTPKDTQAIVVQSNHDEAFDRWLHDANPKTDPVNARFFHEVWAKKLEDFDARGEWTNAFELLYQHHGDGRARFLSREESLKIGGCYVNFHGDIGLNGAAGSTQTYAHLGVKTVIGHSHSPAILDGCYQVGVTGRLNQDYNDLPSSWMNTHCVIYANGKRSLLHVIEGEWRG